MSRLNDLLRRLTTSDPALAADLKREVDALADRRAFGLNFERHVPEAVELPSRRVVKGDKVRILSVRGVKRSAVNDRLWRVLSIDRSREPVMAKLQAIDVDDVRSVPLGDLVVIAEFRDPIYPGLESTGRVEQGGDKPFHAVINAENFHALQTLLFTHKGRIDCIYIDPPYNTGAKDWKYNNNYVEGDDLYRHSKWLAFIERRLLLAKELLNPDDSVLIVTIDEKEYLRLGLLLEQTFPGATIQMVTTVIAPSGQPRANHMSRVEEYIFIAYFGKASVGLDKLAAPNVPSESTEEIVSWENLVRRGTSARRVDRENQFYPFFVDPETRKIVDIGDALLPTSVSRATVVAPDGLEVVWPIRSDGSEGRWRISSDAARRLLVDGYIRMGRKNAKTGRWAMNYVLRSDVARIESGDVRVLGRAEDGSARLVRQVGIGAGGVVPKTVWNKESHNAGNYGSAFLRQLIPGRAFPFPKSLYAVEDTLRLFVGAKKDAIVLDFFSGSGSTAHAVMRLNRQDKGRRISISVTNNEVAADEQARLRVQGFRPGDPEWEKWGICDYITKPRIRAAITGRTPESESIKGDYKFTDVFPMSDGFEENVEFFTLTYESPLRVSSNREFAKVAPLLWMRAGCRGRRIDDVTLGWDVAETYGVLADLNQTEVFLKELAANECVRLVYIVTDEDRLFESVVRELPEHVEPVRLYEAYLRNFEIETGRNSQ